MLLYMPMIPEADHRIMAGLRRIGAVHSVVFGGSVHQSVADRIQDSGPVWSSLPTVVIAGVPWSH